MIELLHYILLTIGVSFTLLGLFNAVAFYDKTWRKWNRYFNTWTKPLLVEGFMFFGMGFILCAIMMRSDTDIFFILFDEFIFGLNMFWFLLAIYRRNENIVSLCLWKMIGIDILKDKTYNDIKYNRFTRDELEVALAQIKRFSISGKSIASTFNVNDEELVFFVEKKMKQMASNPNSSC